jgi:hypothetical protein
MKCIRTILALGILIILAASAWADVPRLINFQGRLSKDTLGTPVKDSTYSILFTIYNAAAGGINLWSEAQSVATKGGTFNVNLGSVTALPDTIFDDTTRYLEMKVGTDPEMSPRQRLTSVAYSFRIASTPWTSFPFAAGYDNYEDAHPGNGFQRVQFRKIGDIVYLRGDIHKADHAAIPNAALLGTLPVGFRPPARMRFTVHPSGTIIDVLPTGDVVSFVNPTDYQFLDGIFFSTSL